jgi:hypothetical protein
MSKVGSQIRKFKRYEPVITPCPFCLFNSFIRTGKPVTATLGEPLYIKAFESKPTVVVTAVDSKDMLQL